MLTLHPLFLLKELIHKHVEEKMPLYIAMLDSEKAYDSVWRDGIFFKHIGKIDSQFWIILKINTRNQMVFLIYFFFF